MKRILLIPGDGIGPEVMEHAKKLLATLTRLRNIEFSICEVDWGAERWLKEGVGIPKGELELLPEKYDAILFGALGDPRIPDMAHGREILLALRAGLDLFINLRPVKLLDQDLSVLKNIDISALDIVIFRENTQDIYGGSGGFLHRNTEHEVAIDESIHTYRGISRIIKEAFEYAQKHKRRSVMLVDKSNAIKFGGSLWQRLFKQIALIYPDIKTDHLFVDVAVMHMVQNPARFDVIVTSNLFGDILSDLGAGLAGGIGLAASANINPGTIALFEPVHGSAPDIAGLGIANPFAMFLTVSLMLDYLNLGREAKEINDAIKKALANKKTTRDLGGSLTGVEAAEYVIGQLIS